MARCARIPACEMFRKSPRTRVRAPLSRRLGKSRFGKNPNLPLKSAAHPKSGKSTMANIGALLKAEITRLCRREIRKEMMVVRKATVSSRHHIAALRKQVSALEQKAGQLAKRAGTPMASTPTGLPER